MNHNRLFLCLLLGLAFTLSGCIDGGIRHGWIMRGQVLEIDSGVAIVCVGTSDGAKVGQVLDVHRDTHVLSGSPKSGATYKRSDVGRVEISELFDDHYARARVLSGSPATNDIVELQMR